MNTTLDRTQTTEPAGTLELTETVPGNAKDAMAAYNEVALAKIKSWDLTEDIAPVIFSRAGLDALKADITENILNKEYNAETPAGIVEIETVCKRIDKQGRIAGVKIATDYKRQLKKVANEVIDLEKEFVALCQSTHDAVRKPLTDLEVKRAAEIAEQDRLIQEAYETRIAGLQAKVDEILAFKVVLPGDTSVEVAARFEEYKTFANDLITSKFDFQELGDPDGPFGNRADEAFDTTTEFLKGKIIELQREEELAELRAQNAEMLRKQQEQEIADNARLEAEKNTEKLRVQGHEQCIFDIKTTGRKFDAETVYEPGVVEFALKSVKALHIDRNFQEYDNKATEARSEVVAHLTAVHALSVADVAEKAARAKQDAIDAEQARLAGIEKARVEGHQVAIRDILYLQNYGDPSSAVVALKLDEAKTIHLTRDFEEFKTEADELRVNTVNLLTGVLETCKKSEAALAEQNRLAVLTTERQRVLDEQAAEQRRQDEASRKSAHMRKVRDEIAASLLVPSANPKCPVLNAAEASKFALLLCLKSIDRVTVDKGERN